MSKIYGEKKGSGQGGTTLTVPQPEIEKWIAEQYANEDDKK